MTLSLSRTLLERIQRHGEQAYPEEAAGFLLGLQETDARARTVMSIVPLQNAREESARANRYLITAQDYLQAELKAEEQGLELVGVFHSHPDHPDLPSEFDREWAQPQFSYLITRVEGGTAKGSRAWRLAEDRTKFTEEGIRLTTVP